MIEARHTLSGKWLADFCSGPYMDSHFRQVNVIGKDDPGPYPLLMFANHFSRWDGFIQYRLNKQAYGRKLYVMMLEEQLRKHMVMNRCGCFSIRKNSRTMIDSMRYASGLMGNPENMVLVFPQGEILSLYKTPVCFHSGTRYVMKFIGNEHRIVFNVNLIDYGPCKKPSLNIYHKTINPSSFTSMPELEDAYNLFYNECIASQCSTAW
ncbi:MAG: 1-acyl-sn-glycerol-3-phosphate acyltransferase [Alistipes sp.]|nr:1-acyl-sn-glycerol-3-phosphate acyltransferase [Alistipes sp.]